MIFSITGRCQPLFALFVIFLVAASSCSGVENSDLEKFEKLELVIESKGMSGKVVLMAEIARTDAQRAQGLMFRKELEDGAAMLFIFEEDQILSFWMKNTLIPLSIAYIDRNGRILEIYDMEPGNLDSIQSIYPARYALEVPQGWFSRAGFEIGDRVHIEDLK